MYATVLHPPLGLGANWQDTFVNALAVGAARTDPEIGELVQLVTQIVAVERQPGGALDPRTPSTFRVSDLRRPLKAYLFYRKHPLVAYAIPLGIVGLAFLLGRASAPIKGGRP